jgi:hypothetical protein
LPDNQSFVYTRDQEMKEGMAKTQKYQKSRVYLHRIGTDVEQDTLVLGQGVISSSANCLRYDASLLGIGHQALENYQYLNYQLPINW